MLNRKIRYGGGGFHGWRCITLQCIVCCSWFRSWRTCVLNQSYCSNNCTTKAKTYGDQCLICGLCEHKSSKMFMCSIDLVLTKFLTKFSFSWTSFSILALIGTEQGRNPGGKEEWKRPATSTKLRLQMTQIDLLSDSTLNYGIGLFTLKRCATT